MYIMKFQQQKLCALLHTSINDFRQVGVECVSLSVTQFLRHHYFGRCLTSVFLDFCIPKTWLKIIVFSYIMSYVFLQLWHLQEEPGPTSARAVWHLQTLLPPGLPGATANTHAQKDQEQLLVRDMQPRRGVGKWEPYMRKMQCKDIWRNILKVWDLKALTLICIKVNKCQ